MAEAPRKFPVLGEPLGCALVLSLVPFFIGFLLIRVWGTPFPRSAHPQGYCIPGGRGNGYWCFVLWQYIAIHALMAPFAIIVIIICAIELYRRYGRRLRDVWFDRLRGRS